MKKKVILFVLILVVGLFMFWRFVLNDFVVTGKAVLTWSAATENDFKGYRVYYGTEKRTADCPQGGYAKKVEAGKNPTFQVNNLKDGQTYYFSVTSYNESGKESCFSEEMSKTIKITWVDRLKALIKR